MLKSEMKHLSSGRLWQVYRGGTGPILVWLHGPKGVNAADPVVTALERNYRVIAPVAPGFNDLDELTDITNIHELALDYDDLFEALELSDVILVGHSFGAMVAAEIAAHFRQRVGQLVLLAPVGLWNDAYPVADLFSLPLSEMDQLLWHDQAARETYAAAMSRANETRNAVEQTIALARSLTALTKFTWPIPDKGLKRRLQRIAAPTVAVFGAKDAFVSPRYAEDFGARLGHGEIAIIGGAGHMLPYERPDEIIDLIERFVAGRNNK